MLRILGAGILAAAAVATVAPAAAQENGGTVRPGAYQCYGGSAGNMKLSFQGPGRYANEQGKVGAFTQEGPKIAFTSGPWEGFFGEVLPDGKVGLSSKPNGRPYYMTCERK
jgi:hypothetical protein